MEAEPAWAQGEAEAMARRAGEREVAGGQVRWCLGRTAEEQGRELQRRVSTCGRKRRRWQAREGACGHERPRGGATAGVGARGHGGARVVAGEGERGGARAHVEE